MPEIKSLRSRQHQLSDSSKQIELLSGKDGEAVEIIPFAEKLKSIGHEPLKPTQLEILQINIGKMCNQVCKHCHVDAGPDRKEIMSLETMQKCIEIIQSSNVHTLDLTGGAPEMNPNFSWFVEAANKAGVKEIIVRSNLTIILANPKYFDLPEFFKKNKVRVVSSLPYYQADKTDRQRGEGVFNKSIRALKMLNEVGYGKKESGLILDLVYNPSGAFLPGSQADLEKDFKKELLEHFGIEFNQLFTITNLPISRFLEYLIASDNYVEYMDKLVSSFNPAAVEGVMCRNTISIGWDGYIYDCDFNQMLDLKVSSESSRHIDDFDLSALSNRNIIVNQHCYGCTAGSGSSCQGAVVN